MRIESVVAALARSVVFHGATQPEDAQLVSEWLNEQNADDSADDTTVKKIDSADDTTDKTFKPTGKK